MPTTPVFERVRDWELLDSTCSATRSHRNGRRGHQEDELAMGMLPGRPAQWCDWLGVWSAGACRGERLVMSALFFHAAIGRFAASIVLTAHGIDTLVRKGRTVARICRPDCSGQQPLGLPSARSIVRKIVGRRANRTVHAWHVAASPRPAGSNLAGCFPDASFLRYSGASSCTCHRVALLKAVV